MEDKQNSFSFLVDNSSLDKMFVWAKKRIILGPDPVSGAKNSNLLENRMIGPRPL